MIGSHIVQPCLSGQGEVELLPGVAGEFAGDGCLVPLVAEEADEYTAAAQAGQAVGGGEVAQVLLDGETRVQDGVPRAVAEGPGQDDVAAVHI